jgi:CubicO group peptidase (beta-lactamase class C family)
VLVVKDGKVIFNKAYGTRTYIDRTPTRITDIYDLASVTKISATTMAVMRLFEQGKLKLDTTMSEPTFQDREIPIKRIFLCGM